MKRKRMTRDALRGAMGHQFTRSQGTIARLNLLDRIRRHVSFAFSAKFT